jgi:hypothetical protein
MGILVVRSHPKLFLCFGLDLKLLWQGQSIEQQCPCIEEILPKMVFLLSLLALVLLSLGTMSLALPGVICCLSSNCFAGDTWCTCHSGCGFLLLLRLVVVVRMLGCTD